MLKNALHYILHNPIKLRQKDREANNLREPVPEKDGEHIGRTTKWLRNKVWLLTSNPYSNHKEVEADCKFSLLPDAVSTSKKS